MKKIIHEPTEVRTIETTMTVDEIRKDENDCPIRLSVIPNQMGIDLCNVDCLTWVKQEDGQLIGLAMTFIPNNSDCRPRPNKIKKEK